MYYGPSHERAKETEANGTVSYNFNPRLDSGLHADYRVKANGDKAYVNYIYAGNRPVGTYTINWAAASNTTSYDLKYFHLDGQGSIIAITNSVGAVVEQLSYDAWGKRRNADGTDDTANTLNTTHSTDHGYTGHEHLDDMGLIHMNGRVYDPRTGRFLQADPTIQSPGNLQSFNRYSYVLNNPFFYTDPSGYGEISYESGGEMTIISYPDFTITTEYPNYPSFGGGIPSFNCYSCLPTPPMPPVLPLIEEHFNGGLGIVSAALYGYNQLDKDAKQKAAYLFSKHTGVSKPGNIYQSAKRIAKGAEKLTKTLAPVGLALTFALVGQELTSGDVNAHTYLNMSVLGLTAAGVLLSAPIGLGAIGVYGLTDYFFDVGEQYDLYYGNPPTGNGQ